MTFKNLIWRERDDGTLRLLYDRMPVTRCIDLGVQGLHFSSPWRCEQLVMDCLESGRSALEESRQMLDARSMPRDHRRVAAAVAAAIPFKSPLISSRTAFAMRSVC